MAAPAKPAACRQESGTIQDVYESVGKPASPRRRPNWPVMPSMKISGAIVAGSSAPRTRVTSFSDRRQSTAATGRSAWTSAGHVVRSRSRSANVASIVVSTTRPEAHANPSHGSPSEWSPWSNPRTPSTM